MCKYKISLIGEILQAGIQQIPLVRLGGTMEIAPVEYLWPHRVLPISRGQG